jgi:simple sugar transport system ATP-binding protein
MVGREVEIARRGVRGEIGDVVLEVEGLSALGDRGVLGLDGVSLTVRAGEVLGIAGVAGNGQRELAETITGMRASTAGSVTVDGAPVTPGVAPSLSIASNVVLKDYRSPEFSRGPLLRLRRIGSRAAAMIQRYDVKAPGPDTPARRLSGGNLQKVVLAREFSSEPRVLVVAAPTRGLDVGAIETVHGYLREAAERGVGVLMISEDLDEVLTLSDRVVVMYEGAIVGEVDAAVATPEEVGLLMAGVRVPA